MGLAPSQPRPLSKPSLPITYPRPVQSIHQIEITSHCNLRCVYCPSRNLEEIRGQEKMFMERDVFARALEWAEHFEDVKGTQNELSITGIGEAIMHPDFIEYCEMARQALPDNFICLSTNGILLTNAIAKKLASMNIRLFVSLHRPEKAGKAIEIAKRHGILNGVNAAFATSSFDWAGQVENWHVSAETTPCEYLRSGWAVVLVDGRITTCCLDAEGKDGVIGTVWDDIETGLEMKPFSLCTNCHMSVP